MRNPEHTRTLIISKATSLFNTKGYRATSISDITKATGITKGAIYGNFDNKDAVAEASFEYASDIVLKEIAAKIRAAPTAPLKLKAIMEYYNEYILNPPIAGGCPVINTSIEADDNYPMLRMKVVRSITIIKDTLKKIINRGILEGQIRRDVNVEEFAATFYAAIQGAILTSRVEGDKVTYQLVRKHLESQIDHMSI